MSRPPLPYLHLGCGLKTPEGWLNVDGSLQVLLAQKSWLKTALVAGRLISRKQADTPWSKSVVRLNLSRPLPFGDGQFFAVYSSHLLEHLYYEQALNLLKECHRVLRGGAICRAVVPDLEALVARYQQEKANADTLAAMKLMEGLRTHSKAPERGLLGSYYRWTALHQHKWMYDAASLKELFVAAGFKEVRQASFLDSSLDRIAEVEDPGRILNGEGVAVEGIRG